MARLARVLDDRDVVELLHSSVKKAGGQVAFAHETGVERSHLNMVLNGKRLPSWSIVEHSIFTLFMSVSYPMAGIAVWVN